MAVFTGVPAYFRYGCMEAAQGGNMDYSHPGWHLGIHLDELVAAETEEERDAKLRELQNLLPGEPIDKRCNPGVWRWLCREFPRCMELIPARRRNKFLEGIYLAYHQNRLCMFLMGAARR